MPNQQLIDYIVKAKAEGMTDDAIKTNLIGAGWTQESIEEALTSITPKQITKSISKTLIVIVSILHFFFLRVEDTHIGILYMSHRK